MKERTKDLDYFGSDPGAVKFGNFINYYSFHNVAERINNLHPNMFPTLTEDIYCLDIGCNTGDLTRELYKLLKNLYPQCMLHILAVDIDSVLINRAQESNTERNIEYTTANVMAKSDRDSINEYLKKNGRSMFDITFCFSVSMWIHLNNGDNGLREFLEHIKTISKSIIIEPQPWKCYRQAQKRIKKTGNAFQLYDTLKIRSQVDIFIESILKEHTHIKVYESQNSSWNRKIQSYKLNIQTNEKKELI